MDWITESAQKAKKLRNHYKLHDIDIFIKDQMPKDIDIDFVLAYVSKRLPQHLLRSVDIIYIGQFQDLINRQINAMYEDGAIFITNHQIDDGSFIDDLVHEVAHSNESAFKDIIYGDNLLNREFKAKRSSLYRILKDQMNIIPPKALLHDVTFNQEIDDFLYKEIGYTNLNSYSVGLFISLMHVHHLESILQEALSNITSAREGSSKICAPSYIRKFTLLTVWRINVTYIVFRA